MRRRTATALALHLSQVPRGWIMLGAALASWMLLAAMLMGISQLFAYVSAVI